MTQEAPSSEWLEKACRLAPILDKYRDEGERERRLPQPVFEAMRDAGFFRMWMPKRFGGVETDLEALLRVGEEVACHDAAAAWNLIVGVVHNFLLAYLPEQTVEEMLVATPDIVIAGAGNPADASATPVDDGYLVSGKWPLASGCHHANWFFGGSFVFDDGRPRMGPAGSPELSIFLFPRDQVQILDTWDSIGLRGTGSNHIEATGIFVPEERRLSILTAVPVQTGPLYRGPILEGLGVLPVVSLGIGRAAIDSFVELATTKTPMAGRTKLADLHTTQERVGRAEMLLGAARAFIYEVAAQIDTSRQNNQGLSPVLAARRRLANVNAVENVIQAVDLLYAIAGTSSIYAGNRLERCVRDVRTVSQHLVAAPSNLEMVGQFLLNGSLEVRR